MINYLFHHLQNIFSVALLIISVLFIIKFNNVKIFFVEKNNLATAKKENFFSYIEFILMHIFSIFTISAGIIWIMHIFLHN